VVTHATDGKESFYPVPTKQDALLIASTRREIEVKRRAELTQLQSHQYGQAIGQMSVEDRKVSRDFCDAKESLRS